MCVFKLTCKCILRKKETEKTNLTFNPSFNKTPTLSVLNTLCPKCVKYTIKHDVYCRLSEVIGSMNLPYMNQ